MGKPFRIQIFGKAGCAKCSVLKQRLDKLLEKPEWQDFEKEYHDLGTEEGLVAFSEAECINPQRIPAVLLTRLNSATGTYDPVPNNHPGAKDSDFGKSRLFQYLGLQTDYSGDGLLTPPMITWVLNEARLQVAS